MDISRVKGVGFKIINVHCLIDVSIMMCFIFFAPFPLLPYYPELMASVVFYIFVFMFLSSFRKSKSDLTCQYFIHVNMAWSMTVLVITLGGGISLSAVELVFVLSISIGFSFWRWLLSIAIVKWDGSYRNKVIIIGDTEIGHSIASELISRKGSFGLNLIGMYDDRLRNGSGGHYLFNDIEFGDVNRAIEKSRENKIRHVYIALPVEETINIKNIITKLSDSTVRVYIVPDFSIYNLIRPRWGRIGDVSTLSIHDTPFGFRASFLKRIEDILLSSIIITLISPLLLAIGIGVKFSSPGPIIFKQHRYGIDGEKIVVWKFRTMKVMEDGGVIKQVTKNDSRLTKFGSLIRRISFDELPQFFNVLQGSMSIVGPRPHAVAHNEEYRGIINRYMLRHSVKPGITGWAQINGCRGETDSIDKMERRVEYDLAYINRWSFLLDIKIILTTIIYGFTDDKAY